MTSPGESSIAAPRADAPLPTSIRRSVAALQCRARTRVPLLLREVLDPERRAEVQHRVAARYRGVGDADAGVLVPAQDDAARARQRRVLIELWVTIRSSSEPSVAGRISGSATSHPRVAPDDERRPPLRVRSAPGTVAAAFAGRSPGPRARPAAGGVARTRAQGDFRRAHLALAGLPSRGGRGGPARAGRRSSSRRGGTLRRAARAVEFPRMIARDPFGWVGSTISGKLLVDAVAGEGTFGVVYRATHLGFQEQVAVKCLKIPADLLPEERRRCSTRSSARPGCCTGCRAGRRASSRRSTSRRDLAGGLLDAVHRHGVARGRDARAAHRGAARAGRAPYSVDEAIELLAPAVGALAMAHDERVFTATSSRRTCSSSRLPARRRSRSSISASPR